MEVPAVALGQAGFRLEFGDFVVFIDPYLSNTVEEIHGPAYARRVPIPLEPDSIRDADLVLISHLHLDHCDPGTLPALAKASPQCQFLAPNEVCKELTRLGIDPERLIDPVHQWIPTGPELRVRPVPAAHPELVFDADGHYRFFGFVLEYRGRRIYHAGDTSACQLLINELRSLGTIDVALLPVNERNFFRERMGIVGNMSVREAFHYAQEIGAQTVVPIHWDMFEPNSVHREEIELLYEKLDPGFRLRFEPETL